MILIMVNNFHFSFSFVFIFLFYYFLWSHFLGQMSISYISSHSPEKYEYIPDISSHNHMNTSHNPTMIKKFIIIESHSPHKQQKETLGSLYIDRGIPSPVYARLVISNCCLRPTDRPLESCANSLPLRRDRMV
jgi:hypothetical protein